MTDCQCKEPGWCERHQCHKHARWHELCQTNQAYFDAWEAGRGPGQGDPLNRQSKTSLKACGPGCHLSRLLAKMWIRDRAGCHCKEHAALMDKWGPDECLERIDDIVEWMELEAKERGLPFVQKAARAMVRIAVWRARRELKNVGA